MRRAVDTAEIWQKQRRDRAAALSRSNARRRETKRGDERTPLGGSHDVLICGASFAGLTVARELAGCGADVLVIDRYEIGERQTSACGIPTEWLRALGLEDVEPPALRLAGHPHPPRDLAHDLPWTFSTFDYRHLCELLWERLRRRRSRPPRSTGARRPPNGDGAIAVDTDRGVISAPLVVDALGWRRILANGDGVQPPDAPLSRGLEVHPGGAGEEIEIWIDRRYVPAGYGWSFPAGDELRIGVGSFDPRFHVKETTVRLAERPRGRDGPLPGQLDPAQAAPRDRGRRLLRRRLGRALPAADRRGDPHRPLLRRSPGARAARRARGPQSRAAEALADYAEFTGSHRWKFGWMLRVQQLVPRVPPRLLAPRSSTRMESKRFVDWSFGHYLQIAPPEFAGSAAEARDAAAAPVAGRTA